MKLYASGQITAADTGRRIVAGRVVTWDETGNTSAGPARFAAGSLSIGEDVRLNLEHDRTAPIGRAVKLSASGDGIDGSFRIVGTRAGDDALVEASEGLRDGFSVEVEVDSSEVDDEGTLVVLAGRMTGVALCTHPAIDSARVSSVAASQNEGEPMSETEIVEVVETVDDAVEVEVVEAARRLAPITTTPRQRLDFASPAEYVLTYIAAQQGDRGAAQRIAAAVAEQGLALNPGIVPAPIVGPVVNALDSSRPVVATSRRVAMPSAGSTFSRPKITQHTNVAAQAAEFDELVSRTLAISGMPVTKATYGGVLDISFQNRDWTDPALMGLVIEDLAAQYAIQTETAHCTAFAAGVTATEGIGTTPDAETFVKGMYLGAAKVAAGCGELPDTLWVAPDEWALIGSLVDTAKRPIFPSLGPVNAGGTMDAGSWSGNPLGIRLVVSQRLAAGVAILGNSKYVEHFEQVGGQLSATNVSVLSTTVAFYGYAASLVTVPGAFVKLTKAAPVAAEAKSK